MSENIFERVVSDLFDPETYTIYTDPVEAAAELALRQTDRDLERRVREFTGPLPDGFPVGAAAFLVRHLARVKFEDVDFATLAQSHGLTPWWLTYHGDKFCSRNHDKKELVQPHVFTGWGRNGGARLKKISLVSQLAHIQNRKMGEIHTDSWVKLTDVHMTARRLAMPELADNTFDISEFLARWGRAAAHFPYFLALAVRDGILIEDYHGPETSELAGFTHSIMWPGFQQAHEALGVKPLIVRMPWRPEHAWFTPALEEAIIETERHE